MSPRPRTIKLTLAYDGTAYIGWQRQAAGTSIQALVETALGEIEGGAVDVGGASRTDAGVHALAQAASARLTHPMEPPTLVRALNAKLPDDVRVLSAEEVHDDFHARFSASSKTYRYRVLTGGVASPFEHRFAWLVPGPLNDREMARAARALVGRHDFAAFQSSGATAQSTVRTILSADVCRAETSRWPGGEPAGNASVITVEVTADGFLRHMVRALTGTLVEVGAGRRRPESIAELLDSRDRQAAGPTAPAHGLFLVRVTYDSR